jgi:hypothetical protein
MLTMQNEQQLELFPGALDRAKELINGERQQVYGSADENFAATANMWSAYLSVRHGAHFELTSKDVAFLMVLLKIARLAKSPNHTDSLVDAIGYAVLSERCR